MVMVAYIALSLKNHFVNRKNVRLPLTNITFLMYAVKVLLVCFIFTYASETSQ